MTKNKLQHAINCLNDAFGYHREQAQPFVKGQRLIPNPNTFFYQANGYGVRLEQVCNGGGARDISPNGTLRTTYDYVQGMLSALYEMERVN
tara:strand:- start:324 stop:596 length:273 start_codon:yes stop_codon:yes gene_type:complete